jgi:hypothetical protein
MKPGSTIMTGVAVVILAAQAGAGEEKTVAERLEQHGAAARARLAPSFNARRVDYPPGAVVFVGLKQEKSLEVYAGKTTNDLQWIRSYPILAASGGPGPKLREGDRQVPEGIYGIEWLNPNSKYHLSMRINYPNAFDREQAARDRRDRLGGDIMIHGNARSVGCLAMGDEAAEDLFVLAADTGIANIMVILAPVDFRAGRTPPRDVQLPDWTPALHLQIEKRLAELPPPEKP